MLAFDESEWLRLLFMLSDTQTWLNEMEKDLFMKLPLGEKKKLFRKTYYINAQSFAHIIERHYHKIARHIGAGKFIVSVPDILYWLRTAADQPATPLIGTVNFIRELNTGTEIGFDKSGNMTTIITVITDAAGSIKTAFHGYHKDRPAIPVALDKSLQEK